MEITQPDVSVTENRSLGVQTDIPEAIPVFIGYTEKNATTTQRPVAVESLSDFALTFGEAGQMNFSIRHFFDNGGSLAFIISLGLEKDLLPEIEQQAEALLAALESSGIATMVSAQPLISIIAVPEIARFNQIRSENISTVLFWQRAWQALLQLSKVRSGLFSLLDAPDSPSLAKRCMLDFSSTLRQWGAAYWPRLETSYTANDVNVVLSPVAAVAAVLQRTDRESSVWKAPANIALNSVVRPISSYINAEGLFNESGTSLNLIRSFPGRGTRIWGCRTLENDPASPWRYIQNRRLVSHVELYMEQLARAFVFEPNNEITWMKFKGQAFNWLRRLWLDGGLYGAQQEQAFEVHIGVGESMTLEDVLAGKMIVKIRLALLSPAEFIEINLAFDTQTGNLIN